MAETTSPDKAEEEIVEHLKKLGVGNPELATKELLEKVSPAFAQRSTCPKYITRSQKSGRSKSLLHLYQQ